MPFRYFYNFLNLEVVLNIKTISIIQTFLCHILTIFYLRHSLVLNKTKLVIYHSWSKADYLIHRLNPGFMTPSSSAASSWETLATLNLTFTRWNQFYREPWLGRKKNSNQVKDDTSQGGSPGLVVIGGLFQRSWVRIPAPYTGWTFFHMHML